MKKRDYEKEAKDLPNKKYSYLFDRLMLRYAERTWQPFFHGNLALELGCSDGEFTEILTKYFAFVHAVDASRTAINKAKKRVNTGVHFINRTFEKYSFPENTFDSIFIMNTLEHVDYPNLLLKSVKKSLSRNGRVFISVPNANAPSRQIAVKMGLIDHTQAVTPAEFKHGHRRTYTLESLSKQVKNSGLQILHKGGIFFKPLANFQLDTAIEKKVITPEYMEGCFQLGEHYPDLCASIYVVAK